MKTKSIKKHLFITIMGLLLSASAFAYDKNDEQTIRQDIAQMQNAIQNKDGKAGQVVVDMMPEPILKEMAKSLDLSVSDTKDLMVNMADSLSEFEIQYSPHLEMFDGEVEVDESVLADDVRANVVAERQVKWLYSGF